MASAGKKLFSMSHFRRPEMQQTRHVRIARSLRRNMGRTLRWLDLQVVNVCSRSRFLSSFYYLFFNRGFSYEQRGFLAGRTAYARSLVLPHGSMALLRRNVHRLEKGLLMMPRRVPFALDYIGETVDGFCVAVKSGSVDLLELQWANDVLAEYFAACANIPRLTQQEAQFRHYELTGSREGVCETRRALIPYQRDISRASDISIDQMLDLARYRRSVRWFLQKPVSREMIDAAIVVGGYAPSACNRQPYEFRVFDDPDLVQKIVSIPFGTVGYAHNVPCIVVIVGKQRNYFDERDRHLIYIDGSLAAMSFVFALECQGLSSCCINWPEVAAKDEQMASVLGLSRDERPVMLVAVGHPDPQGMVACSTKKSLDVVRRYN